MRILIPLLAKVTLLSSCKSPPKPSEVDESNRRPANTAMAIELQVCKGDLQNSRALQREANRQARSTEVALAALSARQQLLAAMQPPAAPAPQSNKVFTIRFDFGSTRVELPEETATALIEQAKTAPLVFLRGRTDGSAETPAESRIARERAIAVRDFLIAAGLDPARIRSTYQPVGDVVADNDSTLGRALNRRVEIEIYHALPQAAQRSHADKVEPAHAGDSQ